MEIYDASEILKMEAEKLKTVVHIENPDKCRLCLKSIKNRIIITNAIRRKFLDVTQTELPTSEKLSKFVCPKCDKDLRDAHNYREKLIDTQKRLCEEVGETPMIFMPEVVHIKDEKMDVVNEEDFDNDDFHDFDDSGGGNGYSDCDDTNDNNLKPQRSSNENFVNKCTEDVKEVTKKTPEKKEKVQIKRKTRTSKTEKEIKSVSDEEFRSDNENKPKSKKEKNGRRKRRYDYYDPELDKEVQERRVTEENGRTYYLCSYCGKNMTTAFSLKEHILTQHRDLEKKFHCDYEGCGRSYVTENRLQIHQQFHRYTKQVVCPTCGKMQTSKNRLREHILSVHEKVKKYFCDKCSYTGLLKSRLRAHVKTHIEKENRRNYPCHICGFVSVCPKYLKRHISDHEGIKKEEQQFTCHCGKTFKYKGALQMHVRCVHDKVKKHVCSICSHAFFHKVDLENHVLVKHNPEKIVKNMPCDICGKLFGIEKQLARHRLYHFVRHECEIEGCGEYFNTAKRLERHMKKDH